MNGSKKREQGVSCLRGVDAVEVIKSRVAIDNKSTIRTSTTWQQHQSAGELELSCRAFRLQSKLIARATPIPRQNGTSSSNHLSTSPLNSHLLSRSPPHAPPIDYASSAPVPPSSSKHANGVEDEDIPSHLYEMLPEHLMVDAGNGKGKVPDYLRMILMCEWGGTFIQDISTFTGYYQRYLCQHTCRLCTLLYQNAPQFMLILSAKVYSAPLNLTETPLTYAVNLSARFGCEVRS